MTTSLVRIGLATALLLGSIGAAAAHAHLKASTPAAGTTISAAPAELRLGFSEGVNLKFTGVVVTGPAGVVATSTAAMAPGDDKTLVVPVAGPLAPGAYKVEWHALATDGHKTDGSYSFTLKP
ncbi:copper resistance protein CopC [Lichenibacterium minor]|uniref:Copper resistance protein CopC n=1 Tax=Lichenibacterium minor TaxID=2316528 RepID=A0A4Q2U8Y3_9HYPH|nr:copper homeostasis periplasmic binding protein CopC [Lichenibacterium minor]RYC32348.1 copper resistance protein CopC [Lichenibacterium minor]